MSQTFVFDNQTIRHFKITPISTYIQPLSTYSLTLPINATHIAKYKIKTKHHTIAKLWVDHNYQIVDLKTSSHRFAVLSNQPIYQQRNSDASTLMAQSYQPITITISYHKMPQITTSS